MYMFSTPLSLTFSHLDIRGLQSEIPAQQTLLQLLSVHPYFTKIVEDINTR